MLYSAEAAENDPPGFDTREGATLGWGEGRTHGAQLATAPKQPFVHLHLPGDLVGTEYENVAVHGEARPKPGYALRRHTFAKSSASNRRPPSVATPVKSPTRRGATWREVKT